ncbi:MAG: hypothetical protein IOC69_04125 [Aestuariivirga sp.]|nr:hypothetical protein [Aestuariivirga sp.]
MRTTTMGCGAGAAVSAVTVGRNITSSFRPLAGAGEIAEAAKNAGSSRRKARKKRKRWKMIISNQNTKFFLI